MKNPYNFAIYNWHVEISSKCPLKCPRCQRTEELDSYTPKQMELSFIKKVFSKDLMSQIMRITFSGNFGDPIYHTNLIGIIKYLKSQNPYFQLVIVTNGSYKSSDWWKELAQCLNSYDEIIFSIDGWDQESNQKYRINSHWESILNGIQEMVKSKALVRWSTILFKYNCMQIEKIKNIANKINVDSFHIVLSERFGSYQDVYLNSEGKDPLEPDKKFISDVVKSKRFKYKFNTYKNKSIKKFYKDFDKIVQEKYFQTKLEYKDSDILPNCKWGYRGVYLDINGVFTPCSWINHPYMEKESFLIPGKIHKYSDFIEPYLKKLNLNYYSLEKVLSNELWSILEKSWRQKGKAYIVCEKKCFKNYPYKT